MWRSLFLAFGLFACILGVECLLIEKAVMNSEKASSGPLPATAKAEEVVPKDWAPWSLMSVGAVVILYSFTLPQKLKASA